MLSSADWWDSMERMAALEMWQKAGRRGIFDHSKYFADARLMFRQRVNGPYEQANELRDSRDKEFIEGMKRVETT